ncbi:hypothetical protein BYT27DRAFT_7213423 [Phlegmacium glaucopus]|nr:hypothetical protein BYT27DRAFT_7213423 [Phlegmacium glaucopus]
MQPQFNVQSQWVVVGSRSLCRTFVKQLLEISPALINVRHPLGWAPLHAAILCGDASMVKFVLNLPGLDDSSTFNATSSDPDILRRHKELCPNIFGKESTSGATALHFACMRGDLEILNLLLEMHIAHDVRDDSKRLPPEYFDLERVNPETFKAYQIASKAWYTRWRSLAKKDVTVLCGAIREGDYDYVKEILGTNPKLARDNHPSVLEALCDAVGDRKPADINTILTSHPMPVQTASSGYLDYSPWAPPPPPPRGSTLLHYACLLGNMKIVEILLRNKADWTISDGNDLLPENYASVNGDIKMREFKRLCEEEELRRTERLAEEEDLRWTERLAEEEELRWTERLAEEEELTQLREAGRLAEEEELRWAGIFAEALELDREKQTPESERLKKHKAQKGTDKKKLQREELRKRRCKWFSIVITINYEIEKIIGDKIIGQRGPIRSIASAIRLRENGWVDPDRPLVMLFLGSSGVGKTELAKRVAYYLHGNKSKGKTQSLTEIEKSGTFVRIDMSEYQHSHTVSNLTGSPKGYVGFDEGGVLTTKLKNNPGAIVLLDEIEKAHPDVLTVFLQLFDDGRITDPKLGTIHCKEAVFIMTSNLGSEEIRAAAPRLHKLVAVAEDRHERYLNGIEQFNKELYPVLKESLKRDEFLGRINQTVIFLPFNLRRNVYISYTSTSATIVVEKLVLGYDVNYGARSVMNKVKTLAIQKIAESQIRGDIRENSLVRLSINDATGDIDMAKEDGIGKSHSLQAVSRKEDVIMYFKSTRVIKPSKDVLRSAHKPEPKDQMGHVFQDVNANTTLVLWKVSIQFEENLERNLEKLDLDDGGQLSLLKGATFRHSVEGTGWEGSRI